MRLELDSRDSGRLFFSRALGGFLRGRAMGMNETWVFRLSESSLEPIGSRVLLRTSSKSLKTNLDYFIMEKYNQGLSREREGPIFAFPTTRNSHPFFLIFQKKHVFLPADSKYDRKIGKKILNIMKNIEFIFQRSKKYRARLASSFFFRYVFYQTLFLNLSKNKFTWFYQSATIIR